MSVRTLLARLPALSLGLLLVIPTLATAAFPTGPEAGTLEPAIPFPRSAPGGSFGLGSGGDVGLPSMTHEPLLSALPPEGIPQTGILPTRPDGGAQGNATWVTPAGADLDGDGLADLFVVRITYDAGGIVASRIELRSPDQGDVQWTLSLGDGVYWVADLVGDSTGDGNPDLALTTFEASTTYWSYPPPGLVVPIEDRSHLHGSQRQLVLVDGASGARAWARDLLAADLMLGKFTPAVGFVTHVRTYRNVYDGARVHPMGDLDGDGVDDLVWQPWSFQLANGRAVREADVIALSGATGALLWEHHLAGAVGNGGRALAPTTLDEVNLRPIASAWSGPDGTGDGVPDIYTSELHEVNGEYVVLRAGVDAASGAPFWVTHDTHPTVRVPVGGFATLQGDAPGLLWRLGGIESPLTIEALNPATGAPAWQTALRTDTDYAYPVADTDGDAAGDVLVLSFTPGGDVVLTLQVLSSATGNATVTYPVSRHMPTGEASYVGGYLPLGDHDGDGGPDLLLHRLRYDRDTDRFDQEWTLLALRTGSTLWQEVQEDAESAALRMPVPDVDGDGRPDVVAAGLETSGDRERLGLASLRGPSGTPVWQRPAHRVADDATTHWNAIVHSAGDMTGDGLEDFLVASWDAANRDTPAYRADVVDGRLGSTRLTLEPIA